MLARDGAALHLWAASDESWRTRADLAEPVLSGAESFLAGTASCHIQVEDVDGLFDELAAAGVLHEASRGGVAETDFATREFSAVDLDNNALTSSVATPDSAGVRASAAAARPGSSRRPGPARP